RPVPGKSFPYPRTRSRRTLGQEHPVENRKITMAASLDTYRLLGRSGLRVSPLALGAMTFGSDWGWGADKDEARRIFDTYVDRGGNFIDTANQYTEGTSERLVGEFSRDKRERLV